MSKNTIPPEAYTRLSGEFKKVKKMGLSQFIQWTTSIFQSGHDEGWNKCVDTVMTTGEHFMVDNETEVEVVNENDLLTLDDVRDAMLSVKGIGARRADMVIQRLMEGSNGEDYDTMGSQTKTGIAPKVSSSIDG